MLENRAPHRGFPVWTVPLVLALLAWTGAIARGGFAYDDREAIFENPVVRGDLPLWSAFARDYWHHIGDAGHWRPLATLSLRLDHALWGEAAAGYHATNVLLHLWVVGLALLVARRLWGVGSRALPIGLCVLAAHPALADSIAWISGRTSMMAALGGLIGLALLTGPARRPLPVALAAGLGLILALAGKEDGLAFAPALWFVARGHGQAQGRAAAAGLALALGLWFFARSVALGAPLPSAPEAPLAAAGLLERAGVGGLALVEGARLVALPLDYPPGWRVEALTPSGLGERLLAALAWLGLFALGLSALAALRRPSARRTAVATLCLCAAILPHLQLIPLGEALAPRFLYLPLLFGAPLIGRLLSPAPRPVLATFAALAIAFAWQRSEVYSSRAAYWTARLPFEDDAPMVWNALGNARLEAGDPAGAREAWEAATQVDPDYSRPWVGLANLALEAGDELAAEEHLRRAVEAAPGNPLAWAGLGAVYLRVGAPEEAVRAYTRATELAPGRAALWRGLARAHGETGDMHGMWDAAARCLELDPNDRVAQDIMGLQCDLDY